MFAFDCDFWLADNKAELFCVQLRDSATLRLLTRNVARVTFRELVPTFMYCVSVLFIFFFSWHSFLVALCAALMLMHNLGDYSALQFCTGEILKRAPSLKL